MDCENWKYISIALLVILIIFGFMYYNKSCRIEGLNTNELMPISDGFKSKPWSDLPFQSVYANNDNTDFMKKYTMSQSNKSHTNNNQINNNQTNIPIPYNEHIELSQCPPCICPAKEINRDDINKLSEIISQKLHDIVNNNYK